MISLSKKTMCIPTFMLSQHLLLKILSPPPPSHPMKKKNKKTYLTGSLTFFFCWIFNFISCLVISFLRISKWYACITSCKKRENNRTAITTASRLTSNGNFSWPLGCSLQNTLFHSFHVASMGFFIHTKYISNKQGYQEIFELLKHTSNT